MYSKFAVMGILITFLTVYRIQGDKSILIVYYNIFILIIVGEMAPTGLLFFQIFTLNRKQTVNYPILYCG